MQQDPCKITISPYQKKKNNHTQNQPKNPLRNVIKEHQHSFCQPLNASVYEPS